MDTQRFPADEEEDTTVLSSTTPTYNSSPREFSRATAIPTPTLSSEVALALVMFDDQARVKLKNKARMSPEDGAFNFKTEMTGCFRTQSWYIKIQSPQLFREFRDALVQRGFIIIVGARGRVRFSS